MTLVNGTVVIVMSGRSRSAIEDFEVKWSVEVETDDSSLMIVWDEELTTLTDDWTQQQQLTHVLSHYHSSIITLSLIYYHSSTITLSVFITVTAVTNSARRYCHHTCLLVGLSVCYTHCVVICQKLPSAIFMTFGTDVQDHNIVNISEVKVKVQGQNNCTENLRNRNSSAVL